MGTDGLARAELLSDVFAQLVRITLSERVVEALTSAEVTYAQFEALRYVWQHPGATVGDLSNGLHISYPSATNMVARLTRKDLLKKKGTRTDRRIVRLILTDAGEALVTEVRTERAKRMFEILRAMPPPERNNFMVALDTFILAAGRCGMVDPDQLCLCCGKNADDEECPLLHVGTVHVCR